MCRGDEWPENAAILNIIGLRPSAPQDKMRSLTSDITAGAGLGEAGRALGPGRGRALDGGRRGPR